MTTIGTEVRRQPTKMRLRQKLYRRLGRVILVLAIGIAASVSAAIVRTGSQAHAAASRPSPRPIARAEPGHRSKQSAGAEQLAPRADPMAPGLLILPRRNLPDPFVLPSGGRYYLYSSQTGLYSPPISLTVSRSNSLFAWSSTRTVLSQVPSWASNGFTWAPDVRRIRGRYVMYFDAWIKKRYYFQPQQSGMRQRAQCIGAATASSPGGQFHPVGGPPLVCQLDHHGAIDPRSFRSPSGVLYLVWKSDDNAFPGSHLTHIFSQRLSGDGLHLVGRRYLLLTGTPNSWDSGLVEAPDLVFAKGSYWLFFSGSWFNQGNYAIGLARCAGPEGPCRPTSRHPFLGSNDQGQAPGEESLFHNHAGWWIVYSPWSLYGHTYRPVALGKIDFGAAGPYLAKISRTPLLVSAHSQGR